jgi:hypothetical protein
MKTIVLFPSYSNKAISIARFLKKINSNFYIVGFDDSKLPLILNSKYFDRIYRVKNWRKKDTQNQCFFCSTNFFPEETIFIPLNSRDIRKLLSHNCSSLNYSKMVYSLDCFYLLDNKKLFGEFCKKLNISHSSYLPFNKPFVVKPVTGSGSSGVRYFHDLETAKNYAQELPNVEHIIEPYVVGDAFGFEGFVLNGIFTFFTGHRRLLEIPINGGSSVLRETASKREITSMFNICSKIVGNLKMTGFVMFEFKCNNQGEFILLECNPRIWGSISHSLLSEPKLFDYLLNSNKIPISSHSYPITDIFPLSIFVFIRTLFKRNFQENLSICRKLFKSQHDVTFFSDKFGFLGYLCKNII